MFQTIKSKVTDISNKTDNKISELDQSSDQKWQRLGRVVEDLTNKVETIWFPFEVLAYQGMTAQQTISTKNSTALQHCSNVSTTPITAMGCRQCLPLSVVHLKSKHCRKPHCCNANGVVQGRNHRENLGATVPIVGRICPPWLE